MKPQGTCCVRDYKGIDIERRVNYPGAINREWGGSGGGGPVLKQLCNGGDGEEWVGNKNTYNN